MDTARGYKVEPKKRVLSLNKAELNQALKSVPGRENNEGKGHRAASLGTDPKPENQHYEPGGEWHELREGRA